MVSTKDKLTLKASNLRKEEARKPPESLRPYMASLIDTNDGVTGVKIVPQHIESFAQYGDVTRLDMTSGKTWYVTNSAAEIDAAIKSWYMREEIEIQHDVPPFPQSR